MEFTKTELICLGIGALELLGFCFIADQTQRSIDEKLKQSEEKSKEKMRKLSDAVREIC